MNLFTEFAFSEQGYNHIKVGKECQDSSGAYSDDNMAIIAVADGHGSDNYPRTAKGSRFAVDAAIGAIRDFVDTAREAGIILDPVQTRDFHSRLKELAANILSRWHDSVDSDVAENPFQEAELKMVSDKYKTRYASGNYNAKAYGTTLIAVCVTESYWFGLHIGDGKCVAISMDGKSREPIPWDEACQSNVTTSLCDGDALEEFRYYCSGELPLAVFAGSDGINDSYAGDRELYTVYHAMMSIFTEHGLEVVKQEVQEFLPKTSKNGSGDDVSIAALIRNDISLKQLRFFKAQEEYSALQMKVEQLEAENTVAKEKVAYIEDAVRKARRVVEESGKKLCAANVSWERIATELASTKRLRDRAKAVLDELSMPKKCPDDNVSETVCAETYDSAESEISPAEEAIAFEGTWLCVKENSCDEKDIRLMITRDGEEFHLQKKESGVITDNVLLVVNPNQLSSNIANYSLEGDTLVEYFFEDCRANRYIKNTLTP